MSSFVIIMVNIRSSRNHSNLGEIFEGAEYLYDLKMSPQKLVISCKGKKQLYSRKMWLVESKLMSPVRADGHVCFQMWHLEDITSLIQYYGQKCSIQIQSQGNIRHTQNTGTLAFKRGVVRELYFQKWLFYKRQKVAVEML